MSEAKVMRYLVSVSAMSDHPIVTAGGALSCTVTFSIVREGDSIGSEIRIEDVAGDTLARSIAIQKLGSAIAVMPSHWTPTSNKEWPRDVVDVALDQALSESA